MLITKRIFAVLAAVLTLAALVVPAFADVIIEPEDGFYVEHSDECSHGNARTYIARTDAGIPFYDEPGGKVMETKPAGERFASQWYYTDKQGVEWRCHMFYNNGKFDSYWFSTEDVLRLYDHNDFYSDHSKEFYQDAEGGASFTEAVLYEFPNGPVKRSEWQTGETPWFTDYYKDEAGREWGYIGYMYGYVESWICLDDPENAELSQGEQRLIDPVDGKDAGTIPFAALNNADDPEAPGGLLGEDPNTDPDNSERPSAPRETIDPAAKPENVDPSRRDNNGVSLWLIIGIVAAAAAICAAVLAILFKKKKNIG